MCGQGAPESPLCEHGVPPHVHEEIPSAERRSGTLQSFMRIDFAVLPRPGATEQAATSAPGSGGLRGQSPGDSPLQPWHETLPLGAVPWSMSH
jgi:hypothetical protein